MKKSHLLLTMLMALLAVSVPVAACSGSAKYTLDKTEADLIVGETVQLTVTSTSTAEFSVTYSSDNEGVATVTDAGLVTAVAEGEATVTAEVDGQELTCAVTVSPISYTYQISQTSATLEEEETIQLTITSTPVKELSVEWTTSRDSVATVNQSGLVTAVAEGEATITGTVDGESLTCAITVEKAPVLYTYTLNHSKSDLEVGKTLELELTVTPEIPDMELTWESEDATIASVDENGVVTALKKGQVEINAIVNGAEVATCKVNAFEYEYEFDTALTLNYTDKDASLPVTVSPNKDIDITYEIVSGSSVTIDTDGNITISALGETTVKIKDGEKEIGTCVVKVVPVIEIEETVQLHVNETHKIAVDVTPSSTQLNVTYSVTEGSDVITVNTANGTITAKKNGTAVVKVTAGDKSVDCKVVVDDVNATVTNKDLAQEVKEQLSGDNVEYWEQYIKEEINHKATTCEEEDIIERKFTIGVIDYLNDYAALAWSDGGGCDKPSKPDGWSEAALLRVRTEGDNEVKAELTVKVFADTKAINLYTGVFKGTNTVTLYHGETAITSYVIKNNDVMTCNLLTFEIDAQEATELKIVLALTDTKADNSFLTLAAASVSGDNYQLKESSARIAPNGTTQISVTKNGQDVSGLAVTYAVEDSDKAIASVDSNGLVTGLATGEARIKVTVEGRVRYFTVNVGYLYTLSSEKLYLHANGEAQLTVNSQPAGGNTGSAVYQVVDGDDVVSVANGKVTALKNGTARIKVTVDGTELYCDVVVNDVTVASSIELLTKDREHPIDITEGAEYWEQYISKGEVNHKQYVNVEEDIIDRTEEVDGTYLSDYAAFLSWHGGATRDTCDCGKCSKDAHTTPDGGWTDKGTKAFAINQKGKLVTLTIKVFKGQSTIKVYTGGYNLKGQVTLKVDGVVLAQENFDNSGVHNSECVSFVVDTINDTTATIELVMTDDYNDAGHSCISLAAVTVSGPVYQLKEASTRIAPDGSYKIVMQKDGNAVTTNDVTYTVTEGDDIVEVANDGTVTVKEGKAGHAVIKVELDGRVRNFTLDVGYSYSLKEESATIKVNDTYKIEVESNPAGATITPKYVSADVSIATVDESDGTVTGKSSGSTTITVTVDEHTTLTFTVTVTSLDISVVGTDIPDNTVVDLTSGEIVYWEHYLYDEINPKAVDESKGEKDLIDGDISGKSGEGNGSVKYYFAGSSGNKENTLSGDSALNKYSWGSNYQFNITVPVGTYEIRVYTGVWQSKNKTSLWDGENELSSHVIDNLSGGTNRLVVFTVTTDTEKVLTLKIDALEGTNCRLNAIAIADTKITSKVSLNTTVNAVEDGKQIDFTSSDILDWAVFGTTDKQKAGGELIFADTIAQGAGAQVANDYKGKINIGEEEAPWTSFKFSDEYVSVQVKVNANVKKMAVYVSGYNADYYVQVRDANGTAISNSWVAKSDGQSVAKEVIFDVTVTEETTLTIITRKMSTSNCGIAGIALYGAAQA